MRWRLLLVASAGTALTVGTVLVFLALDRGSHSASDTLRPFVLTTAPLWLVWVLSARVLLLRRPRR
jgi:hypothetical protein